jgi:hypothetical protein
MKFGFRTPSLKRRIAARTSWKRYVRHSLGFKAPRGWGWLTNPKRAAYNRIYYRTTFGIGDLFKSRRSYRAVPRFGFWSWVAVALFILLLIRSVSHQARTLETTPQPEQTSPSKPLIPSEEQVQPMPTPVQSDIPAALQPEPLQRSEETTEPYVTTNDLSVRSGPGDQFQVLAEISAGTKVNVAGREGEWLRVISKHDNPSGYIEGRFVRPFTDSTSEQSRNVSQKEELQSGPRTAEPTKPEPEAKPSAIGAWRERYLEEQKRAR